MVTGARTGAGLVILTAVDGGARRGWWIGLAAGSAALLALAIGLTMAAAGPGPGLAASAAPSPASPSPHPVSIPPCRTNESCVEIVIAGSALSDAQKAAPVKPGEHKKVELTPEEQEALKEAAATPLIEVDKVIGAKKELHAMRPIEIEVYTRDTGVEESKEKRHAKPVAKAAQPAAPAQPMRPPISGRPMMPPAQPMRPPPHQKPRPRRPRPRRPRPRAPSLRTRRPTKPDPTITHV